MTGKDFSGQSDSLRLRSLPVQNDQGFLYYPEEGRRIERSEINRRIGHCREQRFGALVWLSILIVYLLFLQVVEVINGSYPRPLSAEEASSKMFSEERARKYLVGLTNLGSRIVGSDANERFAVDFLLLEIEKIRSSSYAKAQKITVDVQKARGSFDLNFLGGFTNVYENINNVIVTLESVRKSSNNSVVINCHYDTFINTPGASDDAVSCSVMLDVLKVLSKQKRSYPVTIIFLFNGAEESILQGSHAFVTSHPWFQNVKAFINLEAAGAGGKELLFQAAPGHKWLLEIYSSSVPYPYASSLAQDIFKSGMVQSDTDYRIFRDFGQVPGVDIAYIRNGFIYHTRHDTPDKIPPGCIQRAGENILAFVKGLVRHLSPRIADHCSRGEVVYFDFVGLFMIIFETKTLFLVNVVACFLVHLKIIGKIFVERRAEQEKYLNQLFLTIVTIVGAWVASLVVTVLIALMLDSIGCSMTWFNNNWLLIGLYMTPTLFTSTVIITKLKYHLLKAGILSRDYRESLMSDAEMIIISTLLLWLSWKLIASSYILLFFLLCILARTILKAIFGALQDGSVSIFMLLHIMLTSYFALFNFYCIEATFTTIIPLMGRAGPSIPSDVVIGVLVSLATNYLFMYQFNLLFLFDIPKPRLIFGSTFFIFFLLSTCTSFGFPYSDNPVHPVNQRVFVQHVHRKFNQYNQSKEDSSVMFVPLDRTSLTHLLPIDQLNLSNFKRLPCLDQPYCGWPYFLPLIAHMNDVYFLPAPELDIQPKVVVDFKPIVSLGLDRSSSSIGFSGPEYMSIYITPCEGVNLVEWDLGSGHPIPTMMPVYVERPHYFVFVSIGLMPVQPLQLNLVFTHDSHHLESRTCLYQIAMVGHHFPMDDRPIMSSTLAYFLQYLPSWTSPLYSASTYESWTI